MRRPAVGGGGLRRRGTPRRLAGVRASRRGTGERKEPDRPTAEQPERVEVDRTPQQPPVQAGGSWAPGMAARQQA